MNILVLNGSPRPQGDTAKMVSVFREAAEKAGHSVKAFPVCRMNIRGCLACEFCHGKGQGACAQKDDMQEIYACLRETDMLVLASPIYYHNISGHDKQELLLETLRVLKKGGTFAIHDLMSPARYGDMNAFVRKLKAEGYENVRLIDTTDGTFLGKKEASWLGLSGSTLLVGKK